jgi:hypothetical protein
MALSKARPIRNSRDKSIYVSFVFSACTLCFLTVHALLVSKSLTLLRFVPVHDQAISEGQCGSRVRGRLIAVEQRTCKGSFDVTNSFSLKLVRRGEWLGHLRYSQHPALVCTGRHGRSGYVGYAGRLTNFLQASRWGSGMLASTLLISLGPKPVTVLLCFGRVKLAGPTGPLKSAMGALMEGRRSRAGEEDVAILRTSMAGEGQVCVRESDCLAEGKAG